jgi:predicted GNAT family acetyltransferase
MNTRFLTNFKMNPPPGVRRLSEADAPAVAELYHRYPLRMLTLRMHLEAYGYNSDSLLVWGAFTSDEARLEAIVFRLNNTFILADGDGSRAADLAGLIDSEQHVAGVRGTVETVTGVQSSLQRHTSTNWEISTCLRLMKPPVIDPEALALVRRATSDDIDMLAEHYAGAAQMYRSRSNVASRLQTSRVFVAVQPPDIAGPGRIVSSALLNVEGADAGLIGGVFTQPAARGQGYAAACTAALSLDLQRDGKTPVLFYENPVAGRVYRRLGFEECGKWALLYLAPN